QLGRLARREAQIDRPQAGHLQPGSQPHQIEPGGDHAPADHDPAALRHPFEQHVHHAVDDRRVVHHVIVVEHEQEELVGQRDHLIAERGGEGAVLPGRVVHLAQELSGLLANARELLLQRQNEVLQEGANVHVVAVEREPADRHALRPHLVREVDQERRLAVAGRGNDEGETPLEVAVQKIEQPAARDEAAPPPRHQHLGEGDRHVYNLAGMFTRAVITDEISQDLERAARMAREFGLDQLEIRTAWDVRIDNMNAQELERVKGVAERFGLGIVCLATPFYKCDLGNAAEEREHLEILRRSIHAAHVLGAKIIRTFTFWKHGELAPVFDRIVAAYREPARIAAGEGVVLGVQNEAACFVGTGHEAAAFLEAVGSPSVRAVWDPGNAHWTGRERAVPDGYERIKPYIAHVHLKDVKMPAGAGQPEATVLGQG